MKLKYDGPISDLAFNCKLRHYTVEENDADMAEEAEEGQEDGLNAMLEHLKI